MKTHRSTLHVSVPAQTVPDEDSGRTDQVGRTVRGITILALVIGSSLGAEAAMASGHSAAHTSAFKMTAPSVAKPHISQHRPWMY